MIFVCSMTDLFADFVPDEWIDQVFAVMALAPHHTFQVLTKRAERMRTYLSELRGSRSIYDACFKVSGLLYPKDHYHDARCGALALDLLRSEKRLPNVWLGVSAEDQRRADERIPHLLETPAAVRFVSAEPLLGPIALPTSFLGMADHGRFGDGRLDWIIVGGESGPSARPMHPDWARGLRDQCAADGVPFFFKQWGEWKEAFHDEDGPDLNEVDNESEEADALIAALDGKPGWLHRDGRFFPRRDALPEDEPVRLMERLGRKAAGRLLDGREHSGMPEVRR